MKKINSFFKYIFLLFIIFTQIGIQSCSDNPITNNSQTFDTVETYDWKADTVRGYYLTSFDVVDTNNIYFTANPTSSILQYDGKNFNPLDLQDPLFRGTVIKAWDKNTIFIGGGRIGGSWNPAELKIIRSGVIHSYVVPDDSTVLIASICLVDENRAWLGTTETNIVYFFENGNFTKFELGDNERDNFFFNDQNNNLYLFSRKYVYAEIILYVRKFAKNNFTIIKIDSSFQSSGKFANFQNCTNGDIVFSGVNSIYSFENKNIESIYSSSSSSFGSSIGGLSKNDLIIDRNHQLDFPERNAYIWKDNKIMIERNLRFHSYSNIANIIFFKGRVYISTSSATLPSTFVKGVKK